MLIWKTIRLKNEVGWRSRIASLLVIFGVVLMLLATPLFADDIGDLQSKSDAWISTCKNVYRLDCDDMKQIWTAYCHDYDVADGKDRDLASAVANKMKDEAQTAIGNQLREYDDLKSDAERLKTGSTEEQATKILVAMKTEADRLEKLKDTGAWLGSNNPLIQFAINYGIKKHEDMGRSGDYKCAVVPKKEIPDGSGIPDCISVENCKVYEFKPKNGRAEDQGVAQLMGYIPAVNQYYSRLIRGETKAEDEYGGTDIIKAIHNNKSCYEGDWPDDGDPNGEIRTKFDGEVRTYDACENPYVCTNS